jgi:predicted nucleic acid-binding protein
LEKDLDLGEASCIAIAVTERYDLVLLDEQEAREIADLYKLKKTGTIGILLRAKFDGKITSLKDVLNRLINESDFWISESLYKMIIKEAKEN